MGINDKYGKNRNLWRKVYPSGVRRPPELQQIVTEQGVTYSLDLNKTIRHRDYFEVINFQSGAVGESPPPPPVFGEYDEGLIHFNNESIKSFNYNFAFSATPIVVFTIENPAGGISLQDSNNFAYAGQSLSNTNGILYLSSEYSGTMRYRAVYSSTYPIVCTSPFTASFTCSAGQLVGTDTPGGTVPVSWSPLAASPDVFIASHYPVGDAMTIIEPDALSFTPGSALIELHAPLFGGYQISWIAYDI